MIVMASRHRADGYAVTDGTTVFPRHRVQCADDGHSDVNEWGPRDLLIFRCVTCNRAEVA